MPPLHPFFSQSTTTATATTSAFSSDEEIVNKFIFNGQEYTTYQDMVNPKRKRNEEHMQKLGFIGMTSCPSKKCPPKKQRKCIDNDEDFDYINKDKDDYDDVNDVDNDNYFDNDKDSNKNGFKKVSYHLLMFVRCLFNSHCLVLLLFEINDICRKFGSYMKEIDDTLEYTQQGRMPCWHTKPHTAA